jgi:hypothetical protein
VTETERAPLFARLKAIARRHVLLRRWRFHREDKALAAWARKGAGGPSPQLLKQYVVREYGRRFHASTLVETGTYLGEMIEATAASFDQLYSIELDRALHARAVVRLGHLRNVSLFLGDSGELLGDVLSRVDGRCLLWLDGHYSGGVTARGSEESPVRRELEHIGAAGRFGDVILIDDARCFDGRNGYPTVAETADFLQRRMNLVVSVAEDIIRATPRWPCN